MAENKTVLQRLSNIIVSTGNGVPSNKVVTNYAVSPKRDKVIYNFKSREERDLRLKQMRQDKLLSHQWLKGGYDTMMEQLTGSNHVKVMYRDADLMDMWPEIGAALDAVCEESTTVNKDGKMLNIYSKSERIQSILEDLFVNRLDSHIMLPMIIRATCKYGNEFMQLNIDSKNGVLGWRELPVHEMQRIENGIVNPYSAGSYLGTTSIETQFVWEGHNDGIPFKSWQIAHFRLLKDSLYLPYGVSFLNKARRHWRMLSMMEDAMLLYRLERSIERRIFKVNVGAINEADVQAYLENFANTFKRAPMIDPMTGQVDLRKNFLDVSADYFIPVRSGQDPSSIETLAPAQNPTSMEDIEYMQNKVITALRVPKSYLNYTESQNKGQNLSLLDIRFARVIMSIQQSILMELNKIAIIHLYLLGFEDDLTNFTITLNNPSNQIEAIILDNLQKRLTAASTALQEQACGIPLMSWRQVQKEIMGKTDKEISEILNDIRLEFAAAAEIEQTTQIIKKTGLFNKVDRIYGEPGASYSEMQGQGDQDGGMGGGGGMPPMMGGGPDMGSDFGDGLGDLSEPMADDSGDMSGEEGGAPLEQLNETVIRKRKEKRNKIIESAFDTYLKRLESFTQEDYDKKSNIVNKSLLINETIDESLKKITDISVTDILGE